MIPAAFPIVKWAILLSVRFVTLTALIYSFVTSILQLTHDLSGLRSPTASWPGEIGDGTASTSTLILPPTPSTTTITSTDMPSSTLPRLSYATPAPFLHARAAPATTTVISVPICQLYGDTTVPVRETGAFFLLFHSILFLFLLAFMILAELPLPAVRIPGIGMNLRQVVHRCLLKTTLPQLTHQWSSTVMLGFFCIFLAVDLGSRPVMKTTEAGAWLLLVAGIINIFVGIFCNRNGQLKQARSLDPRKAAVSAAKQNPLAGAVAEKQFKPSELLPIPAAAAAPLDAAASSLLSRAVNRLSQHITNLRHSPPAQTVHVVRTPTTTLPQPNFAVVMQTPPRQERERPRKVSNTPIYDAFASAPLPEPLVAIPEPAPAPAPTTPRPTVPLPVPTTPTPMTPPPSTPRNKTTPVLSCFDGERSPTIVEAWRSAAIEARRRAEKAHEQARRSLIVPKHAKRNGKMRAVDDSPVGASPSSRRKVRTGVGYRSESSGSSHGTDGRRKVRTGVGNRSESPNSSRGTDDGAEEARPTTPTPLPIVRIHRSSSARQPSRTDRKVAQELLRRAATRLEDRQIHPEAPERDPQEPEQFLVLQTKSTRRPQVQQQHARKPSYNYV